jgi:23S rRNA (uracil1939-C5)-methyltransferase
MLKPGQQVELTIEKPAAGGRMIARHEGQVVLVVGAIPGERVAARIERVERTLAFASAVEVREPSVDRREDARDPLCGGCLYSHITYSRQLTLKAEVIADAFTRIGRFTPPVPLRVAGSPEHGYRMRARFHVRGARAGFYREGSHELCDSAQTGQLSDGSVEAVAHAIEILVSAGVPVAALELAENIAADHRVIHLEIAAGGRLNASLLERVVDRRVTGCAGRDARGTYVSAGIPMVSDPLAVLTAGRATAGVLSRQAESFFQANRYLLPVLVDTVIDAVPHDGDVLDLYAGVGLFSIALAASGRNRITAIEGGRCSGEDLRRNAAPFTEAVTVIVGSVEAHLEHTSHEGSTIIADPPRTGMSTRAMGAMARHTAPRIIYVSCDAATMARDVRRLSDTGYRLESLRAFDLFPNTPHVECVAVFGR